MADVCELWIEFFLCWFFFLRFLRIFAFFWRLRLNGHGRKSAIWGVEIRPPSSVNVSTNEILSVFSINRFFGQNFRFTRPFSIESTTEEGIIWTPPESARLKSYGRLKFLHMKNAKMYNYTICANTLFVKSFFRHHFLQITRITQRVGRATPIFKRKQRWRAFDRL